MYLKSIEVNGFKSFANKIKFEFHNGITGIVGPNGSGKSNVADAVRWVLGEQRIKQLRGNKMEDVIFAGTALRKPDSYAFVAITLDNSDHKLKVDFDEVTISRRIYRSGESEYMINGSLCRLRDLQEMFYDTGIGKEGYSIIGQGQIDKILQGKPEERRELFDEAAGIVKFKKRKTIALRKLENERANLTRISDILSELGRQVGPLKRQAEAADKYVAYRDELKKYDLNLFLIENGDIKEKISECERKEKIASDALEAARAEFESMKEGFEKISGEIQEIDEKIETIRNKIAQSNVLSENMTGQINVLNEQINSARDSIRNYAERSESIKLLIKRASEEIEKYQAEKKANEEALAQVISQSNDQDDKVIEIQTRNEEKRAEIESLKEKLIEEVNKKGEINARIERLAAMQEQMAERRNTLAKEIDRFTSDKDSQAVKVKTLEDEFNKAETDEKDLEEQVASKEKEKVSCEREIRAIAAEIEHDKEQSLKSKTQLESLKNLTERYEGYGNSIREVMKLRDKLPGIHGVVADIIKVEKKYEIAIETALGGSIQNIVTDTEQTAKEAIEFLKKNKLGRATFLPLKAVTGRGEYRNDEALSENGVIGLASQIVEVEEKYRGVANYLLGKIFVCDNIDNALRLARKNNYSLIIVTLEGELLNRGGSMSGGAYKNKSNLLGRRREIDELESLIARLEAKAGDLAKKTEAATKNKEKIELDLADIKTQLQTTIIYKNTVAINLQQAKTKLEEIGKGFENVSKEDKNIELQSGSILDENNALNEQLVSNEAENERIKNRITELSKELENDRADEAKEVIARQTLKVEHSKLLEQNSFICSSIERAQNDFKLHSDDLNNLESSNVSSSEDIETKTKEIESIREAFEKAGKEIEKLSQELKKCEDVKAELNSSHNGFIQKREEFSEKVSNLDKEVFRLGQLKEKLEDSFESKSAYIWEEYELTYNAALEFRNEALNDVREMKECIAKIKNSIRGLGVINVSAIEEYKEVNERYEFLKGQHDDLKKAEEDLVKIIKDLDKEMRRQFNREFRKICEEFSKVFADLFGGGTGTIELEEDVDVLDAGITIIAQPPGKKLQNMMQLSGGEKALTAIAVLFAIQNLKPSPFCILDEIEAALDDSNIGRFADYLHRLSDETQFIVITHRKGTMEAADRLYGITMQEKGVSTLISVSLEDYKEAN